MPQSTEGLGATEKVVSECADSESHNKCVLSTHYVPGTICGSRDPSVDKTDSNPTLVGCLSQCSVTDNRQQREKYKHI